MAKLRKVDKMITSICNEYKVKVLVDVTFYKDYGECYPDSNEIMLSKQFSSDKLKIAIFLHELAHILTIRRKGKRYIAASIFQEELAVWSLAQELHVQHFGKAFSKPQADFMLKCLKSYSQHCNCFKKKFNKDFIESLKKKS